VAEQTAAPMTDFPDKKNYKLEDVDTVERRGRVCTCRWNAVCANCLTLKAKKEKT
jgi:hypothetical protein